MADFAGMKKKRLSPPPAEASENLTAPEIVLISAVQEPVVSEKTTGTADEVAAEIVPGPKTPRPRERKLVAIEEPRVDGRTLRRSNRTIQFATRVTPDFDRRVRKLAQCKGLMMIEVLERALELYEKSLK